MDIFYPGGGLYYEATQEEAHRDLCTILASANVVELLEKAAGRAPRFLLLARSPDEDLR